MNCQVPAAALPPDNGTEKFRTICRERRLKPTLPDGERGTMSVPSQTGALLADEVLARRAALPVKFAPVTLAGAFVRLEPLNLDRDVEALYAVSNGQPASIGERSIEAYDPEELIWRYMYSGPFDSPARLAAYLRPLVDSPNGLCLCVVDRSSGRPGSSANPEPTAR